MPLLQFNVAAGSTTSITLSPMSQFLTQPGNSIATWADGSYAFKPRRPRRSKLVPSYNPNPPMNMDPNIPVYYSEYVRFDSKTGQPFRARHFHPCGEAPDVISLDGKR